MKVLNGNAIKKIQKILAKQPNVIAAYLFGSAARGQTHPKSDVDIGVVVSDVAGIDYGELCFKIGGVVSRKEVDLRIVVLKKTSPVFLYNLIKENLCLYAKSEKERVQFETQALRRFYDSARIRKIYRYYLRKAIKEDTYGRRQAYC